MFQIHQEHVGNIRRNKNQENQFTEGFANRKCKSCYFSRSVVVYLKQPSREKPQKKQQNPKPLYFINKIGQTFCFSRNKFLGQKLEISGTNSVNAPNSRNYREKFRTVTFYVRKMPKLEKERKMAFPEKQKIRKHIRHQFCQ